MWRTLISVGVLASVCPRPLIEEVLAQLGKASQRERLLPAPAVVYYVMALALWRLQRMSDPAVRLRDGRLARLHRAGLAAAQPLQALAHHEIGRASCRERV